MGSSRPKASRRVSVAAAIVGMLALGQQTGVDAGEVAMRLTGKKNPTLVCVSHLSVLSTSLFSILFPLSSHLLISSWKLICLLVPTESKYLNSANICFMGSTA